MGTLPNGMRYLVLRNYTPPRQVAMRMVIDAGSMQERPGEEGVAHFLEHLAFRGTEAFPDGELNRQLENLGLQMGDDVNASTGPDRTTFQFDLARNDTASIDTGLQVIREIVSRMAIAPKIAMKDRIVAGFDSVRTKVPAKHFSSVPAPPASAACCASGAFHVRHASHSRKAAPPADSGTRAPVSQAMTEVTPKAPMAP